MKLLFFDIDGTLIADHRSMPPSTPLAIKRAQENGHLCIVNTGRTAAIVLDWLPAMAPFDGYLCGCGTQIFFQGQELLHHTFTREETINIIDGLNKYKIDAILEGAQNDYCNPPDTMFTNAMRNYVSKSYARRHWGNYQDAIGHFDKFYCFADDPAAVPSFMAEHADLLDAIDREHGFYEIVPKGFSKATCMDALVEYLNNSGKYPEKLSIEDTVAIGDSNNDLPMLEHAGCAIAMGESSQQVLAMADFITAPVMQDGIYKALEWLGCI
ncbi:MAG: HAD family phosphatase [Lachnospiraceae bacterium]|nr:HAD family phosphatase [Lachnospiraceae bacterium]